MILDDKLNHNNIQKLAKNRANHESWNVPKQTLEVI